MNKTVLITGASSGIGEGCARKFASQGARLILNARNANRLEVIASELKEKYNAECYLMPFDVCDRNAASEALEALPQEWKSIDILINNAGVLDNGLRAIDNFTDDDMNRVIDINTKGTMCMMREITAEMAKSGYGSIVNVASVAGVMGCGGAAYVASKAAIIGITRHTALRFAGTNIRCNAICPGTIVTPMVAGMSAANMDMNIFGQMMKHNDLKVQPCMPEDVANMLLFFASDESRAITGQSIVTDFGSTL